MKLYLYTTWLRFTIEIHQEFHPTKMEYDNLPIATMGLPEVLVFLEILSLMFTLEKVYSIGFIDEFTGRTNMAMMT